MVEEMSHQIPSPPEAAVTNGAPSIVPAPPSRPSTYLDTCKRQSWAPFWLAEGAFLTQHTIIL